VRRLQPTISADQGCGTEVDKSKKEKMMEHFTGPLGEIDAFGNGENTQAHRINLVMTTKPQTLQQTSLKCGLPNVDRIRAHMGYLTERGFCNKEGQTWVLTEGTAATFFGDNSKNSSN
jgi:hypothetical protein